MQEKQPQNYRSKYSSIYKLYFFFKDPEPQRKSSAVNKDYSDLEDCVNEFFIKKSHYKYKNY